MMQLGDIQYLFDYTLWADGVVLDGARHIGIEQLQVSHSMPHGSIHDTLTHIMSAQQFWLIACGGTSAHRSTEFHDLDELGASWAEIHADLRAFIAGLNVEQLRTNIAYQDIHGQARIHPLQWLMLHVFNHSTEHRSQVAAMIVAAGYDVGWLDMVFFMWNVAAPQ